MNFCPDKSKNTQLLQIDATDLRPWNRPKGLNELKKEELRALVREMQVRQIDLELTNSEFQIAQGELETELNLFSGLFEFSPAGFITICENGIVRNVNLMGSSMLQSDKQSLIGKPFIQFVAKEDVNFFYYHIERIFCTRKPRTQHIKVLNQNGDSFQVKLNSSIMLDYEKTPKRPRVVINHVEIVVKEEEGAEKGTLPSYHYWETPVVTS